MIGLVIVIKPVLIIAIVILTPYTVNITVN